MDLFGMGNDAVQDTQIALPDIPEVSKRELLSMEKETTGLYLSGHPMDEYRELAQKASAASIRRIIDDLSGENASPAYKDGMTVRLACVITAVRLKSTKNGSMMAYVTVEDESASIELVVFPRSLQQCGAYLTEDSAVLLTGRIDAREDEAPKVLLNEAQPLTEAAVGSMLAKRKPGPVGLFRPAGGKARAAEAIPAYYQHEKRRMAAYQGRFAVAAGGYAGLSVSYGHEEKTLAKRAYWCQPDVPLLEKLRFLLGENDVIIQ